MNELPHPRRLVRSPQERVRRVLSLSAAEGMLIALLSAVGGILIAANLWKRKTRVTRRGVILAGILQNHHAHKSKLG